MPLINTAAQTLRRRAACLVAALAAAPLLVNGAAHAQPGPGAPPADPRAACESPDFGGAYVAITATLSECHYIVSGAFYYDNYDNGVYTGTLVYRDGAKVPTERPQVPDTFTMPGGVPLLIPSAG
ncbi:hypothetical protein C6A85_000000104375 [Mycobacterium sp. ITM-2017-0098]|nr:hypothetical protein C6A85_000000104375 [Mycobacterium sp. ITM-2017-0098]